MGGALCSIIAEMPAILTYSTCIWCPHWGDPILISSFLAPGLLRHPTFMAFTCDRHRRKLPQNSGMSDMDSTHWELIMGVQGQSPGQGVKAKPRNWRDFCLPEVKIKRIFVCFC